MEQENYYGVGYTGKDLSLEINWLYYTTEEKIKIYCILKSMSYKKLILEELQQEKPTGLPKTTSPLYKYNCSTEKESLPEPNWKENKRSK